MSSLIILCPHCLTWIEPHADCCPECGKQVDIEDDDPPIEILAQRLGNHIADCGLLKLSRRGWPSHGQLVVTTEGLLFVPQCMELPNGALESTSDLSPSPSSRVASLFHWWSIPPWRRPTAAVESQIEHFETTPQLTHQLLLDTPGAFFIQRKSIQRISVRWGRIHIERRPSRSVTLLQAMGGQPVRDAVQPLLALPDWRAIFVG